MTPEKLSAALSGDNKEALYAAGHICYVNGKFSQARQVFRLLTVATPHQAKAWKGLAASCQMMKNYPDAIDYWGMAAMLDGGDCDVHLQAAHCFLAMGNLEKAFVALKAAEMMGENQPQVLQQVALLRMAWQKKR